MRFYRLLNPSGPWRTTNVNLCSKQTFIQLPLGSSCTAVAGGQVWPKDLLSFDLKLGLLQEFLLKLGISYAWLLVSPTSTPAGSTQPCYWKVWKTVMYLVWAPCLQLAILNCKEYSATNSSFLRIALHSQECRSAPECSKSLSTELYLTSVLGGFPSRCGEHCARLWPHSWSCYFYPSQHW